MKDPRDRSVLAAPCKHKVLKFADGGLHIVCECGQAWQAVQANGLTPDFWARTWGLSELDVRKDPLG